MRTAHLLYQPAKAACVREGAELRRRHSWYGVQHVCAVEAVTRAADTRERGLEGDTRVRLGGRFPAGNECVDLQGA